MADGAVSFYLDHAVTARVSPFNYGVTVCTAFDGLDTEHVSRRAQMFVDPSGVRRLAGQYDVILAKVVFDFMAVGLLTYAPPLGYSGLRRDRI